MTDRELDESYESAGELRGIAHEFARDVLRPTAREIDAMDRDEYVAITGRDSPYWDALRRYKRELGGHREAIPEEFGGGGMTAREFHVLLEELAWGSPGFAIAIGTDLFPAILAAISFDDDVTERFLEPYLADEDAEFQGCWGLTEPLHGSETFQTETILADGVSAEAPVEPPQATLREDGDEYLIDGRKSRWVSTGPLATHCALHVELDPNSPSPGYMCLVPLDSDGVTRGEPIEKLGQRECPQGPLEFDDVRIPPENVVLTPQMLDPETGMLPLDQLYCFSSAGMAVIAAGLARAAFEEALAYAREREQGGRSICRHQSIKRELYEMYERVQTTRHYSRTVLEHVWDSHFVRFAFDASPAHALAAQVHCTEAAFEVAHRAMQVHGANGITTDYHVEKLFRDARVTLIEDGTSEVLGMEAAEHAIRDFRTDQRRPM